MGIQSEPTVLHANLSDVSTPHVAVDIATDAIEAAKILARAVTLAKLELGIIGDLLTYGSGGVPERLNIGTALQTLRVNAGATALEYATPTTGGGTTLSETGSGTGVSANTFVVIDPLPVRSWIKIVGRIKSLQAGTKTIAIRFNGDSGNNYSAQVIDTSGTTSGGGGNAQLNGGRISVQNNEAVFEINFSTRATTRHPVRISGAHLDTGTQWQLAGDWTDRSAITAFSFTLDGNFDHTFQVYSFNES